MVRVGLVGCGTIGRRLAQTLRRSYPHLARLSAIHDGDMAQAIALRRFLRSSVRIVSLNELIRRCELVIEAASADAAVDVAVRALRAHRDVLIMSVGGLLRNNAWRRIARRSQGSVWIPSGALAGLDGVKALAVGTIKRVSLTTRKPPQALAAAPYILQNRIELDCLKVPRLLFEGSPLEVVKAFPQNTNVAATLALAVSGQAEPKAKKGSPPILVRVIADPTLSANVHELEVEGDCGRIHCRVESRPSANPRTSELAVRSAIATLSRIFEPIRLGT